MKLTLIATHQAAQKRKYVRGVEEMDCPESLTIDGAKVPLVAQLEFRLNVEKNFAESSFSLEATYLVYIHEVMEALYPNKVKDKNWNRIIRLSEFNLHGGADHVEGKKWSSTPNKMDNSLIPKVVKLFSQVNGSGNTSIDEELAKELFNLVNPKKPRMVWTSEELNAFLVKNDYPSLEKMVEYYLLDVSDENPFGDEDD